MCSWTLYFLVFTWHVAEVASVTAAKFAALQLGSSPVQAEFVPMPAVVPQMHEPPENGDTVAYPSHVE